MTIRDLLEQAAHKGPDRPATQVCHRGVLQTRTYGELAARVRQVSELAGSLGLLPRETPAALILDNGPEWLEIYAGLACCGIPVVPVDPKLRPAEVAYLLGDAAARAVFTDARHLPDLQTILPGLPSVSHLVVVNEPQEALPAACADRPCLDYTRALAGLAARAASTDAWYATHPARPDDVASLIYTSGTTGRPKGARLTHANFCTNAAGALQVVSAIGPQDRFLVVLPLFNSFSFTANFMIALSVGACLQLVGSLRTLGDDLRFFSPSILMAVPLLVTKLHARIEEGLRASPLARLLLAVGLTRLVARGVRRSLGGRLRLIVTGGAPCPVSVIRDLRRLRLPIIEGYGLTEAAPVVSLSRPDDARPGTIGYALPNIEVRIADPDAQGVGELQVRGPNVMAGYHGNPEATAEVFDGNWLRTGDLASVDADGYLTIRGRRKALIVNREGKNIYPEEVEQCLARDPRLLDVLVIGYRDRDEAGEKVGAIVVPNLEAFSAQAPGGAEPGWDEVRRTVRRIVQEQCRDLADYKRPRKVDVRREPLERTSIQKVRRHVYQGQLDAR